MKIIDAHAHVAQYVAGFTSRGELRAVGGGKAQYSTGEIFQLFPPEMGGVGVTPEALVKVMDVKRQCCCRATGLDFRTNTLTRQ